jgi:flagellar export protein FliJ
MKTPYDAALRVQQREIDEMSAAISTHSGVLGEVEKARDRVSKSITREADLAAGDLAVCSHAYLQRMRHERHQLTNRQVLLKARLDELRDMAVDAYGTFRAIETAADGYRQDAERVIANAEQAGIDDFAAMSFIKARRAMRREDS